jgi:hypothetical protein
MPTLGGKSFRNRGSSGTPILQRLGSGGGGGNQILAQGRVYELIANTYTFDYDQVGFDGAPVFYSSGATGYNGSRYGIDWTFSGIDVNKHIIKVYRDKHKKPNSSAGGRYIDPFLGWEIVSGTKIRVIWDLSSSGDLDPLWALHYISVEASPF